MGFAQEMRAPSAGCLGFCARAIMKSGVKEHADAVEALLDVQSEITVVELGPGSGGALRTILRKGVKRVYAIELSEVYRNELNANQECAEAISSGRLSISGEDALSLPHISDNSVDRVLGINVVYFLDPLDIYLKEMSRILKRGGLLVWTVKDMTKKMDKTVYVNTDWHAIVLAMAAAGFEASIGETRLANPSDPRVGYIPIIGKKR